MVNLPHLLPHWLFFPISRCKLILDFILCRKRDELTSRQSLRTNCLSFRWFQFKFWACSCFNCKGICLLSKTVSVPFALLFSTFFVWLDLVINLPHLLPHYLLSFPELIKMILDFWRILDISFDNFYCNSYSAFPRVIFHREPFFLLNSIKGVVRDFYCWYHIVLQCFTPWY